MIVKEYTDLSVSRAGVLTQTMPVSCYGAHFRLDADVSLLFPYINSMFEDATFHEKPEHIQFFLEDIQCALYPREVIAASFKNEKQAREFAERLIETLNDLYRKRKSLKPDHRKVRPVSVIDTFKLLPQTNCSECGYPTCLAFACAVSKNQTTPDCCPGLGKPIFENVVYPMYDKEGNLLKTVSFEKKAAAQKNKTKGAPAKRDDAYDLTPRELQVLRLLAQGSTNSEISVKLGISPHTVKSHVIHIFNKLGVNDRTQAAVWAARHNVI